MTLTSSSTYYTAVHCWTHLIAEECSAAVDELALTSLFKQPWHSCISHDCIPTIMLTAGKSLVCTVWFHKAHNFPNLPQRLGIVYCLNRPCSLYSIKIPFTCKNNTPSDSNPQAKCLTTSLLSAMSPNFSPDGDKLVFVSHDAAAGSGVHHATAALKHIHWSPGNSTLRCCVKCCCMLQEVLLWRSCMFSCNGAIG